jgi:hypothetical protein
VVGAAALVARFAAVAGRAVPIGDLVALARDQDPLADRFLGHAAATVARQLAPVCAAASVGRIALAGPLVAAGARLRERLRDELALLWAAPVEVVALDPPAVLRGALSLARLG